MAQNKIQRGEKLQLTAPAGGVVNEMGYLIGGLFVVAQHSADEADPFTGDCEGVHELPKATGYVVTEGEVLYWDVADEEFNSDTTNEPVAIAVADAGSSATTVSALINPRNVDGAAAAARLDDLEELANCETNAGVGDQVNLTDTNAHVFTEKVSIGAAICEADDFLVIDGAVWVDDQDSTPQITIEVLVGTTVVDTLVIATAADNDWAHFNDRLKLTAVGASLTAEVTSSGAIKDGTVAARANLQKALAITASSTAGFDITVRATSNAGHADNLVTLRTLSAYIQRAGA